MRSVRAIVSLTAVLAATLVASCGDDDVAGPVGPTKQLFNLTLTGAAERPNPVTTTAGGTANLAIYGNDSVEVTIRLTAADSITLSHFHSGDENSAGPVMYNLFAGPTTAIGFNGQLVYTRITRSSAGFAAAFTFDSLLTRLRNATTYVNVHSRRNGGGELRAQVK